MPGFALALIGALGGMIALLAFGSWGVSLWFGVPFAAGSLLGYRVRAGKFSLVLLALMVVSGMIFGMASMSLAGVYCGMALAAIFVVPIFVGTVAGIVLRHLLKSSSFSQRWHLPTIAMLVLPLGLGWLEGKPTPQAMESVSTTIILNAPVDLAWESIQFYEEVKHDPPWILKVGLARPLHTSGLVQAIGDQRTCVYNNGHITKEITEVTPNQRLAFRVIEQNIGYEMDVRLQGGAFELERVGANLTRITLTTQYEPLLSPRFAWQPFERFAIRTLHQYVLEGMQLRAEEIRSESSKPDGVLHAHLNR